MQYHPGVSGVMIMIIFILFNALAGDQSERNAVCSYSSECSTIVRRTG